MGLVNGPLRPAVAAALAIVVAAACGTSARSSSPTVAASPAAPSSGASAPVWPAPANPMDLTIQAGLKPQPKEFLAIHVHAHLDVFVNGARVTVPAGIGIQIDDPAVHMGTLPDGSKSYGGIQLCNQPCISPLHTHDTSGVLHTESTETRPNTLGEFFTEWGVTLDGSCVASYCAPATAVAIYVDGQLSTGDPRAIALTDHREIAVVIGTSPAQIPASADFSNA